MCASAGALQKMLSPTNQGRSGRGTDPMQRLRAIPGGSRVYVCNMGVLRALREREGLARRPACPLCMYLPASA